MNKMAIKLLTVTLLAAFGLMAGTSHAASIIFVTNGGVGTRVAPDAGWTNLLVTLGGHTLTTYQGNDNPNATDISFLDTFDLVIVGRGESSAGANFNSVTAPLIAMNPYLLQTGGSDWGWGLANPGAGTAASTTNVTVTNASDPIWSGIGITGGVTDVNIFSSLRTTGDETSVTGSVVGTATDNGRIAIANISSGVASGPRMFFAGHDANVDTYNLTATGGQVFLNAVDLMAVPEPSTFALLGLGLGALFLARRRK